MGIDQSKLLLSLKNLENDVISLSVFRRKTRQKVCPSARLFV